MPATGSHYAQRDNPPAFDPQMFYKFSNPTLQDATLSAGIFLDSNGAINMKQAGSLSSENWQIFFQSGRYFIRNYDYGSKMQLGLTEDNRNVAKLYPRSGSIGQQWTINKVDGGWELVNGLAGPGTYFALPSNWPAPGMRSDNGGSAWNITSNTSAAQNRPLSGDWTNPVDNFQVVIPTPSATPSSAPTSSLASASTPTNAISQSTVPTNIPTLTTLPPAPLSSSSGLAGGAIAGIAVGGVAVLAAIIFALWLFYFKKRKASKHGNPYEIQGAPASMEVEGSHVTTEKYAYRAELAVPPVELAASGKDSINNRAELDSSYVEASPKRVA